MEGADPANPQIPSQAPVLMGTINDQHVYEINDRTDRYQTDTEIFAPKKSLDQIQKKLENRTPFTLVSLKPGVDGDSKQRLLPEKKQSAINLAVDSYCGAQHNHTNITDIRAGQSSHFDPLNRYDRQRFAFGNNCNNYNMNTNDYELMVARPMRNKHHLQESPSPIYPPIDTRREPILDIDALKNNRNKVFNGFYLPTQRIYVSPTPTDKYEYGSQTQVSEIEQPPVFVPPAAAPPARVPMPPKPQPAPTVLDVNYLDRKQGLYLK